MSCGQNCRQAKRSGWNAKPTENGEAYLAFVQAHDLSCAMEDLTKLKQSEQLYQRAIELDPNFALALARYSQLESWMVRTHEAHIGTPRQSAQSCRAGFATTA